MFFGTWELRATQWRLCLPREVAKKIGRIVIFQKRKDGLVIIRKFKKFKLSDKIDFSSIFVERVKSGRRVTVPPLLRKTYSFRYGKNIFLLSMGDYLLIRPRK